MVTNLPIVEVKQNRRSDSKSVISLVFAQMLIAASSPRTLRPARRRCALLKQELLQPQDAAILCTSLLS